ncbi:MAG TPA: RNA/single-stranded DNA exonuclease [Ruminococcus sp.]|nr:RNA/single-stranded DNA exonuclease [Ruminococcus sp.]
MKKKFPLALIIISVMMFLCELIASFMLCKYNVREFMAISVPATVLCIVFIAVLAGNFRHMYRHVSRISTNLEQSGAEFMNFLPAPAVVIDKSGIVVWYNEFFREKVAAEQDIFGYSLLDYISIDLGEIQKGSECLCMVNGNSYKVRSVVTRGKDEESLTVLYFSDVTDLLRLEKTFNDTRQSVVILMIDNYDDIMQNAKETEKAKTSVETEQLIENFMNGTNGIVKKISDNTFVAVLEDRHLNKIIEEKFKILDSAREIKLGERNCLTFSIGVGQGAGSLEESEKIARQCLDMALGRGGDQAVVKTENGFRFFGGVSKGVEKKSRAKTRIIANTLQDFIEKSDNVFIMGHSFGDLDSIGAATGLASAVRLLGKNAYVAVDRKKNLAIQLIEHIEETTKVDDFYISPQTAVDSITDSDLLIIVDTHNKDFIESKELYKKAKNIVVIDHHRKTVNFIDNAVIFHHEPYASSASEMVTELIQYFKFEGSANIDACYAEALLSGITLDTKNFIMRTGVRTFEAAAYLRKLGADTVTVKKLFSSTIESYKRRTQIVSSADIHNRCAIASTELKSDDIRLISPQAADDLLSISGVDASFVVYRTGDTVNISARSLGGMNVQVIMERLGGGGHQTMAAAQIKDVSVSEAVDRLKNAIDESLNDKS